MYTTGLQAPSSTPAATFAATLHDALIAGGLEFVETYVNGATTANVYRSAAVTNSFGQDWYLFAYRNADTAPVFYPVVAEVWDTGTKKCRNYAVTGATRTPTSVFAINDAVGVAPTHNPLSSLNAALSAAGFQYWISANPDRVVVATRVGATDYGVYCGLYDDVLPPAISPFPLCAVKLVEAFASGAGQGGATREPGATTSTTSAFGVNVCSGYGSYPYSSNANIYQTVPVVGRAVLHSSRAASSNVSVQANTLRGHLKGMAHLPIINAVNGDTLTVTEPRSGDVRTYTLMGATPVTYWADQGV